MKTENETKPARPDAKVWKQMWEIAGPFFSAFDLDVLLKEISQAAADAVDAEAASLLLISGQGKNLFFRTAVGEKGLILRKHSFPADSGLAGWVAGSGEPLMVNDVSADERFDSRMDQSTGFQTRSVLAVPLRMGKETLGVCEAINKKEGGTFTPEDRDALQSLADLAASIIVKERAAEDHRNFFTHAVHVLTAAIEASRPDGRGRPARVAKTACAIGQKLGVTGRDYRDLYYAALLQDVGTIVQGHVADGAALLKDIRLLSGVEPLIRHHRERWDGSGHPDGLKGEQIPLGARIIGLADELEMPDTRNRKSRAAREGSGTLFDPKIVEAYIAMAPAE